MSLSVHPSTAVQTMTAGEALAKHRFVGLDGSYVDTQGDPVTGVTLEAASSGDGVSVQAAGVVIVEASDAISAEAAVQSTTAGKAVTLATPGSNVYNLAGHALDAATGDGDLIRVKLGL